MKLTSKTILITTCVVAAALVAEFLFLEGALGISLPSDRKSAISTVEITTKGLELHFITRNKRFTVVDLLTGHGSRRETLMLRESFFMDRTDSVEGPPSALVTVEGWSDNHLIWSFREPGERGDLVTNNLYMVSKPGNGENGNTYTYFSMADGRKVRTQRYVELSNADLEALDLAVAK